MCINVHLTYKLIILFEFEFEFITSRLNRRRKLTLSTSLFRTGCNCIITIMTQETLHFKQSGMKIFGLTKVEADITYRDLD